MNDERINCESSVAANTSVFQTEINGSNPLPRSKDKKKVGRWAKCRFCERTFASFNGGKKGKMKWRIYCSRKCFGAYNSLLHPKRIRPPSEPRTKRIRAFCQCGAELSGHKTLKCRKCYFDCKRKLSSLKTLADLIKNGKGKHRYQNVRNLAKRITALRKQECEKCKYNLHVETAHIKGISTFPLTALISEINSETNLMLLCPNCHWELDNTI